MVKSPPDVTAQSLNCMPAGADSLAAACAPGWLPFLLCVSSPPPMEDDLVHSISTAVRRVTSRRRPEVRGEEGARVTVGVREQVMTHEEPAAAPGPALLITVKTGKSTTYSVYVLSYAVCCHTDLYCRSGTPTGVNEGLGAPATCTRAPLYQYYIVLYQLRPFHDISSIIKQIIHI